MGNQPTSSHKRAHRLAQGVSLLFLFGAFALVGACSDEPTGPGPIPLDDFRGELAQATCDQFVRCGFMPDAATCKATQGDSRLTLQLLTDAVIGRVSFDPTAARACVEAIRTLACDTKLSTGAALRAACDGMFVGTVPEGGPCLFTEECSGTGSCDVSMCMGGGACCLGVCTKLPSTVPVGGDCTTNPCVDDAYCDQAAMPFTCKARKSSGDACDAVDQCKDGQRCNVGGSPETCYLLQNHGGQCNPALSQGACARYDDFCPEADRKCSTLPKPGEPCTPDNKCLGYAYCDMGTCKKRPGEGEACVDNVNCLGTLECQNMICTASVSTDVCAF